MSSFTYGQHTKKHIGVWLRFRSNPDILSLIQDSGNKRYGEVTERVVIDEYDNTKDEVWLAIWCKSVIDIFRRKDRYNVFYIKTNVNEAWVCEGDLGNGVNF